MTIAFRMTDAERHELEERIRLSGMRKQDYLIKSTLEKRIVVVGNRRMFKKMDELLSEIKKELSATQCINGLSEGHLASLRTTIELLESFESVESAYLASK